MYIKFQFSEPQDIRGLYYDLGEWKTDFPRSLVIKLITEEGATVKPLTRIGYQAVSYYRDGRGESDSRFSFYLSNELLGQRYQAVVFEQKGSDSFFDWSIAEIGFY